MFVINDKNLKLFKVVSDQAEIMDTKAYAIGGYVRDMILKRATKDVDIVCEGNGVELATKVAEALTPSPKLTVYSRYGTAMFKYDGIEYEFVGARKESYSKDSRNPDVISGTIKDDQERRDFTINAMAISLNKADFGDFVDPFNGIADLEKKIIKTPTDPSRTFSDDPLRMLRAIRFATQLEFEITEETLEGIKEHAERINIIVQERITTELNKILLSKQPSIGFKLLFDTGILQIIFPKMADLHGVEIKNGQGHKDNFYHTLEVIDNLSAMSESLWLRWAAVLHDIAKPPTKRYQEGTGWTFHGHEALGAIWVPRIFKKLKLPLDHKMKYVQKLVRLHLRPISLTKENITDSAIRRLLFEAGDDIDDLMLLCQADITSKNPKRVQRYQENYVLVSAKLKEVEEKDQIRNWQPPIDGELIMKTFDLTPCRQVGVIKTLIREAILDGDIPNEYQAAYDFMLDKAANLGLAPVDS